jgi:hypothetical protein
MARTRREFGRRGPPVVTHRPEGLPAAKPADPKRKRSLAISLFSAGALAAAATHFMERGSAEECVPVSVPAAGSTALPRATPTGAPTTVPVPASSGASSDGCPPGTVRSTSHSGSRRHYFSSWHWSSGSSSSGSGSVSHASTSTTRRGGFGSIGSFHFSGGS